MSQQGSGSRISVSGSSKLCDRVGSPRCLARYSAVRLTQTPSSAVPARRAGAAWTPVPEILA